jgi:predicted membrane channel-forming protein YqfA (hemolysin III family)
MLAILFVFTLLGMVSVVAYALLTKDARPLSTLMFGAIGLAIIISVNDD